MVTVRIDDSSHQAKALIEMLKTFAFVEIEELPRYNEETEKAIREAREGKTEKVTIKQFRERLYA